MPSQNLFGRYGIQRFDAAPKGLQTDGQLTSMEERDAEILGRQNTTKIFLRELKYRDSNDEIEYMLGIMYEEMSNSFPDPFENHLPKLPPSPPCSYEIRDIHSKGKGVVALRDIAMGEIIMMERPIFFYPMMTFAELQERIFNDLVAKMQPRTRERFLSLSNVKDSTVPHLLGIQATNSMEMPLKEGAERYGGVFLDISRINHSCGPNTTRQWNRYLFVTIVQASRNIRAGEEITTWYEPVNKSHADRRFDLERKYKFKCTCGYCTNTSTTSDYDRAYYTNEDAIVDLEYRYLSITLAGLKVQNNSRQKAAQDFLQHLIRGLVILTKEGIEGIFAQVYYVYLMQVYGLRGDKTKLREWGFKAILMYIGSPYWSGEKIEQWIDWMRDPEKNFPYWAMLLDRVKRQ
ncbi:hypothetical protein M422DRAFT_258630 [Sphaerobolus stellatus SS14]|uniref:SET domain-containing protein n=1 Tax=Sphaerobolus stellatus (strain SS14) TaxID=990650 RepID=A0A0C9VLN9_SPHS4|nr:hypothetical protein M422DRAFT_275072 [Sphaerobolus stellatus SS14]KIJ38755.1 hypothetical protein M422DRAFT_258630 [Sphaerobolus stellatus SS14]